AKALRAREELGGFNGLDRYASFTQQVHETKRRLLEFLIAVKRQGKSVVGYGAPGKGNTLLNYCGIRTDFLDYTVDRNPYKHGKFTPGTHIPIYPPDRIAQTRPDYVLILPWNLKDEIIDQMAAIRAWGGQFVVPIPDVKVYCPRCEGVLSMRCPTLRELPPPPAGKTGWPWTEESASLPFSMADGARWPPVTVVTPSFNQAAF